MRSILLVLYFTVLTGTTIADQNGLALKALLERDFEKAEEHLIKSLVKNPINPGAKYIYSTMYSDSAFSRYNIDSAYYFALKAIDDFQYADAKTISALIKNKIYESYLIAQRKEVENQAFNRSLSLNTVMSFNLFMDHFPLSDQIPLAIKNRNALAFEEARKVNMWEAYKDFIESFPDADQIPEAQKAYEQLLFSDYTEDGKLLSLQYFLADHPNSPHKRETELNVLKITAGLNRHEALSEFLTNHSDSDWIRLVMKRFFHLDRDFYGLKYFDQYAFDDNTRDSLLAVINLNKTYLLPFYELNKYGFMNASGETVLEAKYDYIKEEYFCGNIQSDVLEVRENGALRLINYLGKPVFNGGFDEAIDLRGGFVKMRKNGRYGVWHKGGFDILDAVFEDVDLLKSNAIKAKKNGRWALYSVFGEQLTDHEFSDIYLVNDYWIFEKDGLLAITNFEKLIPLTDGNKLELDFRYDEVELVKNDYLLCYSGKRESLLNKNLQKIISESEQTILPLKNDWIVKSDKGVSYFQAKNGSYLNETFKDIVFSRSWMGLQRDSTWTLLGEGYGFTPKFNLDSIRILNDYVTFYQKGDTVRLAFYPRTIRYIKPEDEVRILGVQQPNDSSQYVLVNGKVISSIYSEKGELMFRAGYDAIDYLTEGYFSFEDKRKKGILNDKGLIIVKAAYEGIGQVRDSLANILSKGKFGAYDLSKKILIKPNYLKRIEKYASNYLVALKEDGYGFLNREGEELSEFIFSQVEFWNDSISLVKQNGLWNLYSIPDEEIIVEGIREYEYLKSDVTEKLAYFYTSTGFGVFSNVRGEIMAPTYNDIINLGSPDNPLYFAEKHIPEADFYIVVYADANGDTVKSQAYREEEYEKILCAQ
ncbi:MAG: WG repeat-containing protein [Bacteroidetes bacterium]|nr:WG repeat-containing protein [Bacteroidota bacterium]MDA1119565.1 WG repeat-containing protein [Bacteroidota bacterium]